MIQAAIARHGKKLSDTTDSSIWKPKSILRPEGENLARCVGIHYGFLTAKSKSRRRGVFASEGFVRTHVTGTLMTGTTPTSAIELSPYAIWREVDWKEPCFKEDGSDRTPIEMLTDFPHVMRPVGLLGANFVQRKIAGMNPGESIFCVTHQPIAEAITAVLTDQWPLKDPIETFAEGDVIVIDFDDETRQLAGVRFLSGNEALKAAA